MGAAVHGNGPDPARGGGIRDVEDLDALEAGRRAGGVRAVAPPAGLGPIHGAEQQSFPHRHVALAPVALHIRYDAGRGGVGDIDDPEAVVGALEDEVPPEGQIGVGVAGERARLARVADGREPPRGVAAVPATGGDRRGHQDERHCPQDQSRSDVHGGYNR